MGKSFAVFAMMLLAVILLAMLFGMNVRALVQMDRRIRKQEARITELERTVKSLSKNKTKSAP